MKKWIIILMVAIAACNSKAANEQHGQQTEDIHRHSPMKLQLNKGSKWKADEATKKNVAAMKEVVNDSSYADAAKRMQLYANLQSKIDRLVKQCSMNGAEHDALHVWLEKVMKDMKELKEENNNYSRVYAELKRDIERFNAFFE